MPRKPRLFFDIETTPDYEAALMLPTPSAPSNYKDQAKIDAYVEKKQAAQLEKAALDPHTGRVLSLGWATNMHGDIEVELARADGEVTDEAESALLTRFWDLLEHTEGRCVGFNIIGFDLPYIMVRSFALGVERPAELPDLGRYQDEPSTDLFGILCNWSWDNSHSQKWLAERHGLDVLMPGISGADIEALDDGGLVQYTRSDVHIVQQLYQRMDGYFFKHE